MQIFDKIEYFNMLNQETLSKNNCLPKKTKAMECLIKLYNINIVAYLK